MPITSSQTPNASVCPMCLETYKGTFTEHHLTSENPVHDAVRQNVSDPHNNNGM